MLWISKGESAQRGALAKRAPGTTYVVDEYGCVVRAHIERPS